MSKEQKTIRIPEGFKVKSFDNDTGEILLRKVPVCITERIKTLKGVLDHILISEEYVLDRKEVLSLQFNMEHLYFQWLAELIVSALNEGWEPDMEDNEQHKWVIEYFAPKRVMNVDMRRAWITTPIRLIFRSRIVAQHVLDTPEFIDVFKKFMLIEKD